MPARPIKRGNVWYTYYHDSGKKRWVRLGKTAAERDLSLEDLEGKIESSKRGVAHTGKRWDRFCEEYLEGFSATNKVHESYLSDKRTIRHFNDLIRVVTLRDLTPQVLEEYKRKRKVAIFTTSPGNQKSVQESSINRELNTLKAMMVKAVEWGYLRQNPWKSVKKFEQHRSEPPAYSNDEMEAILDACIDVFERTIELLGCEAGLRRGEMVNIRKEDVDFGTRMIRVVSTMGRRTKTKRERFVPMTETLESCLQEQVKVSQGDFVLSTCGEKTNNHYLTDLHAKIVKRAGIKGNLHRTRHTFGTNLAKVGVPLNVIKDLMGHSQITTTQIYLHTDKRDKVEAIKKLSGIYSGSKKSDSPS